MRILVKNDQVGEFFNKMVHIYSPFDVAHFCNEEGKDADCIEFTTNPHNMGYAEADEIYLKLKDIVEDIWQLIVGDQDLKVGKNSPQRTCYVWESCKKKYDEEEKKNEE